MKHPFFLVLCALFAACGKGTGPEPKTADKEPEPVSQGAAPDKPLTLQPKESGRKLVYEFLFMNAKVTMSVCADGPFVHIDETWESVGHAEGRRWGAERSRMIFDSANKILTVINLSKNTFVSIGAARMAKAQEDLEKGTPMSLGNLSSAKTDVSPFLVADGVPFTVAIPLPAKTPKKKHPEGCAVFERDLPQGLKEETCFLPFDEDLALSEAFSPFVSMAGFVEGLEGRVRELEVISAAANALEWDLGIPAAQFKFGDSPFEEDTVAMESWDRTFTLKERRPCTITPADLDPPQDAVEEFGILPWNTPFIVTALPK